MTWAQIIAMIFAGVFSALYQSGVIALGWLTGNAFAWKVGLAAAGLTYLSFAIQIAYPDARGVAGTAVAASIVAGTLAGLALLWK
jgi:hypothetical protein